MTPQNLNMSSSQRRVPELVFPPATPSPPDPSSSRTLALENRTNQRAKIFGPYAIWGHVFQKLSYDEKHVQPFIFLLEREDQTFKAYEHLVARREKEYIDPRLTLTADLWHELRICRDRGDRDQLCAWLSSQLGHNRNLLPTNASPSYHSIVRGVQNRSPSGGSYSLARNISNGSTRSRTSRRASDATTINSDSGLSDKGHWPCPLISRGYCEHEVFVRWGNFRNHVESKHKWYVNAYPNWADEATGIDKGINDPGGASQRSPRSTTPADASIGYLGAQLKPDRAAAISFTEATIRQAPLPHLQAGPSANHMISMVSDPSLTPRSPQDQRNEQITLVTSHQDSPMDRMLSENDFYDLTAQGQHISPGEQSEFEQALFGPRWYAPGPTRNARPRPDPPWNAYLSPRGNSMG